MKTYFKLIRAVSFMGQLGFTLLTPPLVLILLAWWLQSHFGLGAWVMILALLIGLVTSAVSAYQFYRRVLVKEHRKMMKEDEKKPVVYYHHE